MAEPWTCSACDRKFARTGQKHVCARYYVEDHLDAASSAARRIYDAFLARLAECGPFELAPTRRQIGLRGELESLPVDMHRSRSGAGRTRRGGAQWHEVLR